jgi:hypothetical protein
MIAVRRSADNTPTTENQELQTEDCKLKTANCKLQTEN